jgi:hypothetical protein
LSELVEKLAKLTKNETEGYNYDYEWFANSANNGPVKDNWLNNETCKGYLTEMTRCKQVIDREFVAGLESVVTSMESSLETLEADIQEKIQERLELENNFFKKFGRFIQEGNWISEEYTDDELYYIDSLSTLYTSSRPKVTYSIDVFALKGIKGYENYDFEIGDKTFIEDAEFFGWKVTDGFKTPIRQEIIVSEINENFDDITKNSIKVQNYKTQFEDLF